MQFIINIFNSAGIIGLILTMVMEGASIPFPGIIVVLTLGYVLKVTITEIFLISAVMSAAYSLASYIPYIVGFKLGNAVSRKYGKQLKSVQNYFYKYGEYSIALLRPLAVGNYISYFAGMGRTKLWKYFLLTFAGIYPWSFIILLIGRLSNGNISKGIELVQTNSGSIYVAISLITAVFIAYTVYSSGYANANELK